MEVKISTRLVNCTVIICREICVVESVAGLNRAFTNNCRLLILCVNINTMTDKSTEGVRIEETIFYSCRI